MTTNYGDRPGLEADERCVLCGLPVADGEEDAERPELMHFECGQRADANREAMRGDDAYDAWRDERAADAFADTAKSEGGTK